MSAYHVEQDHINALVSYAKLVRLGLGCLTPGSRSPMNWAELGELLSRENDKSVNFRYNEEGFTPYKWVEDMRFCVTAKPVDILSMISCYEYQTCEHPEWEASAAKRFCELLRDEVIRKLPGYDRAIRQYKRPAPQPQTQAQAKVIPLKVAPAPQEATKVTPAKAETKKPKEPTAPAQMLLFSC